jgi:transcriptional regulator with XRE-family HTH domain
MTTTYSDLLKAFLDRPEITQSALAEAIGKSQAAVNRYAQGLRFPDAVTAMKIDEVSGGEVGFSVWKSEMERRVGLAPAEVPAAEPAPEPTAEEDRFPFTGRAVA